MSRYAISSAAQIAAPPRQAIENAAPTPRHRVKTRKTPKNRGMGWEMPLAFGALLIAATLIGAVTFTGAEAEETRPSVRVKQNVRQGDIAVDRERYSEKFDGSKLAQDLRPKRGLRRQVGLDLDGGPDSKNGFIASWMDIEDAMSSGDYKTALRHLTALAEAGDFAAKADLGTMFLKGLGVRKDYSKAMRLYQIAADRGESKGQVGLGWIYEHGLGVEPNHKRAFAWYDRAAQAGDAVGQERLGWLFQHGLGILRDDAQAVAWYRKSAEQGHAAGEAKLGWMYLKGRGVVQDLSKALTWSQRAAENGDASGQNQLAWMYEQGEGLGQDLKAALFWYEKAVEQGHASAAANLSRLYKSGVGVTRDLAKALELERVATAATGPRNQTRLVAG